MCLLVAVDVASNRKPNAEMRSGLQRSGESLSNWARPMLNRCCDMKLYDVRDAPEHCYRPM